MSITYIVVCAICMGGMCLKSFGMYRHTDIHFYEILLYGHVLFRGHCLWVFALKTMLVMQNLYAHD